MGFRLEGLWRTIIPLAEAVDELAVGALLDGGFGDAFFVGIGKNG